LGKPFPLKTEMAILGFAIFNLSLRPCYKKRGFGNLSYTLLLLTMIFKFFLISFPVIWFRSSRKEESPHYERPKPIRTA
jgi:hypothetical protein